MKKMMTILSKATLALTAASLVGCAFGNNTDEQNKYDQDQRGKLLKQHSQVVGEYKGSLQSNGRVIPLEATVVSVDQENGKNQNGEPRFIPTLKIRYRQLDTVRPDLIMSVRYVPDDGSFTAAENASPSSVAQVADGTTLRGNASNNEITGVISRNAGILGAFVLERTDVNPQSPIANPEVDYHNRLRNLYKSIEGTYEGGITPPPGTGKKFITLRLSIFTYDANVNGKLTPVMQGSLVDPDTQLVLAQLNVSYQLEYTPALLNMSASTAGQAFSITGNLNGDVYTGEASSGQGYLGKISLTKKVIN